LLEVFVLSHVGLVDEASFELPEICSAPDLPVLLEKRLAAYPALIAPIAGGVEDR